jgi:hypothetical protein
MESCTTSILVGYDYNKEKDNAVLIVGKTAPNKHIQIINTFRGEEATALYNKLTTKKGE